MEERTWLSGRRCLPAQRSLFLASDQISPRKIIQSQDARARTSADTCYSLQTLWSSRFLRSARPTRLDPSRACAMGSCTKWRLRCREQGEARPPKQGQDPQTKCHSCFKHKARCDGERPGGKFLKDRFHCREQEEARKQHMDIWNLEEKWGAKKRDRKWNPRGRTPQSPLEANRMNACRPAEGRNRERLS